MVRSLIAALRQVCDGLATAVTPTAIHAACHPAGHAWRDRRLDPVTTAHLFLLQILHGNTACARLPRLTGRTFSASAYCQARGRLPLAVCQALLRGVTAAARPLVDTVGLWRGHRTWFVDGTGVSMPDAPDLTRAFGYAVNQRRGCGFPVTKVVALFHAGTGLIECLLPGPLRSHEMARAAHVHPHLRAGDVLVGDRAFGSYAHLALLVRQGLHGLFRLNSRRVLDFTPGRAAPGRWDRKGLWGKARSQWVRTLGPTDQVVDWYKPYVRPAWPTAEEYAALPKLLRVREARHAVGRPGFRVRELTLVTTLLEAEAYPLTALADLYRQRWQAETDLRHLKTTLGMDVLRCRTEAGVLKELAMFAVVYNLVRVVMAEAGRPAAGRAGRADQLRRRAAMAGDRPARRAVAPAGRQPGPSESRRAAVPEAAGQELPVHDPPARRVEAKTAGANSSNLTS